MRVKRIRHQVHTEAAMQIQILLRKRLTNKRIEKRVRKKAYKGSQKYTKNLGEAHATKDGSYGIRKEKRPAKRRVDV